MSDITNNLINPMKFPYNTSFTFPKQSQRSRYKMDLYFWDWFGREKIPSYNQRNMVPGVML